MRTINCALHRHQGKETALGWQSKRKMRERRGATDFGLRVVLGQKIPLFLASQVA
jgi:hypothetical protein